LAALSPIGIAFLEIAIVALLGGKLEPSRWRFSSEFALTMVWLVAMGATGEEGGWRGFAQPLLQSRLPIPAASVLVGVMWALWHIPGYFVTGLLNTEVPFWRFAALIIANAVIMGWIVNGSGGSVLLASLYHFSLNASTLIAGSVLHKRVGTTYLSGDALFGLRSHRGL
jgi:membrane protease YdiL (CAAX protease family)